MAVDFLIGRAGTGKTAACADRIRRAMAADPLGSPLLWITPQQATFSAERTLLTGGDDKSPRGTFRARVLSFRRLALEILADTGAAGAPRQQPMGDIARIVLLEEVVRGCRNQLQIFSIVADRPGFIQKLDATLRELRQHGHTAASLRQLLTVKGGGNLDTVTARKIADLATILQAWAARLQSTDAWDFESIMQQAALLAHQWPLVAAAEIWVDGFSALSALEIDLLAAVGKNARKLTITILADPGSPAMRDPRKPPGAGDGGDATLFARTERMYKSLLDAFRKNSVPVAATTFLRTPHRFAASTLRRLESDLFTDSSGADALVGPSPTQAADGGVGTTLEIWESSDPETEVRIAAQAIREFVTHPTAPLRYRDIGLIVPNLEGGGGYQDALRRIFTEHNIPHFIDQRRSIAHHPLVELLKSAVAIVTNRWARNDVLLYLKTSLAGVRESDVALVENYLLAHGIDHLPWSQPWLWFAPNQKDDDDVHIPANARDLLQRVNDIRAKVWADLRPWIEDTAGQFVSGLQQLLAGLGVEERINTWVTDARGGDAELAQIHEQAWRQIDDLLNMLDRLLKDSPRSLQQFETLLASALETLTLGLIPPTVDQVLVSSVTRSRTPELHTAIILGAVEGQLPMVPEEDPILSDTQRESINAASLSGGGAVGLGSDRQLFEMPFFDYVAFTRASSRLIVSYPLSDSQGKAIGKSRYIPRLKELFGDSLVQRRFDAASRTAIDRIGTLDDLLTGVLTWSRDLIRRRRETLDPNTQYPIPNSPISALYNWLVTAPETLLRDARQLVWPSLAEKSPSQLSPALAAAFYPSQKPLRLSVSQLEKFAACPLQYFLHYTLGLRPREFLELDTLNLGLLYHRILERFFLQIIAGKIPWPNCDPATLRHALDHEVDAACEEIHQELAQRTPAYDQMRARTQRTLAIILEGQRRRAALGKLQPLGVEVTFSSSPIENQKSKIENLPVLPLSTPAGHTVHLAGKIDRVDGNAKEAVVIDYKSASKKSLKLPWIYTGLALQLPVYAIVMNDLAHRQPAAALYLPLGLPRQSTQRPDQEPPANSDQFFQKNQPTGIIDDDDAPLLDSTLRDQGKSDWFKMKYNKDGSISKTGSDLFTHADFTAVLDFVRWKILDLADDLVHGRIAPAPFRDGQSTPCDHCDFTTLCPFDRARGAYHVIPKLTRDEALTQMRDDMKSAAPTPSDEKTSHK